MAILSDDETSYSSEETHSSSSSLELSDFSDEKSNSGSLKCKHESLSDMLMMLKIAAVNPCNPRNPKASSWNQVLKVRKVLFLSHTELPWKKRKLDQLLGETSTATFDSLQEKPNEKSVTKLGKVHYSSASSISCLISSTDSNESSKKIHQNPLSSVRPLKSSKNLPRNLVRNDPSLQADALVCSSPSSKEVKHSLDSDDSVSGSNSLSPKKPLPQNLHGSLKLLKNSDESVNSLNVLAPKGPRHNQSPRKSVRLLNFVGDYIPRMAIPVGPRFQADIPDWTGSSKMDNSSKWLGTRIWPIENSDTEISREMIRKGRPNSCSCHHPGSTNCIQQHISEERLRLKSELGSAFFSWRFHEMGEVVSKTWTLKEQESFKRLVKMNRGSKNKSFLKLAMTCFPHKGRESIVSYYFNVFILRCMRRQTRLAFAVVDSDDDDEVDENVDKSKELKSRYLVQQR